MDGGSLRSISCGNFLSLDTLGVIGARRPLCVLEKLIGSSGFEDVGSGALLSASSELGSARNASINK